MTTQQTTALELCRAILSIVRIDPENGVIVNDKLAADEISQLFLDANIGGGIITGPYLENMSNKVWYITTH